MQIMQWMAMGVILPFALKKTRLIHILHISLQRVSTLNTIVSIMVNTIVSIRVL